MMPRATARRTGRLLVLALAVATATSCGAPEEERPTLPPPVAAQDTTPLPRSVPPGGELLCEVLPAASVELALSGRDVISSDGQVQRRGEEDDGPVIDAECEVFVRGQDAPALVLAVERSLDLPEDVRRQVDEAADDELTLPPQEAVGIVEQLYESTSGDVAEPAYSRARVLTGPVVGGEVDPLVVIVLLGAQTTGRDTAADSAALAQQVAEVLQLPLLDREQADAVLPPLRSTAPPPEPGPTAGPNGPEPSPTTAD